ncbi:LysR family transcriptional regulator [filamentous cyanobacterium LEGE 11480]|uniref:LysR family transcriptional regulator n=1 Tax=Romeriopsis navalis LEGE 11480 TaxID=2777977 RepID=A0A928VUC7_9CYAN|nr:LysR family transcriptional regulator [Romeriopsis navalis]MBE9032229.1 LysR family transcriptional regulator [Romeriopsis navalis LEGE 11480]
MQNATLHQLKVFAAVASHNSFTRAAEELFLTQPTVSMQVKQLSKTVGLPLFEQVGKKLYLTEAGRELYATCQDVFARLAQFEIAVADIKGLKQGTLRIAVVTTAKYVIPRILGPFCRRYPGIDISLTVTNHQRMLDSLSGNQHDLYIMSQPPEDIDVKVQPFLENPLIVLASRSHVLAKQPQITLERLAEETFIMREPGSGTRKEVQKLFETNNVTLNTKLDLGSNETIKQAVAGGLGIAVLSKHTLSLEGSNSQLAILDVEGFPIKRHWYVVHTTGKHLSAIAQAFYEYLMNEGKQVAEETAFQGLLS